MPFLSLIELPRLTPQQQAQLSVYGDRWARLRLAGATTDRAEAEEGVRMAYRAAGLAAPSEIVWGGGPVEIAWSWAGAREQAGDNVRAQLVDIMRRKAETAVDRSIGLSARVAIAEERRLARVEAYSLSVDEAVNRACQRVRPRLRARAAALLSLSYRKSAASFATSSFNFHSIASLGAMEYVHDVCGLKPQTVGLAGLWRIIRQASWIVPHARVCWLAERPSLIEHDANGRLHAAKGPAVRFPDGWKTYAWKGVLVPEWIIERPDLVTVRTIANADDPQIRRCMIDILTPERFIAEGGATCVGTDETGILWRRRWRWEAWAAVEVRNGTPEPDGTYRRYFLQVPPTMRTPREAVAWTYGLSEQRYHPVVRT